MSRALLAVSGYITPDGVHVLALSGEIDHTTAGAFVKALATDNGDLHRHTVIDFSDVTFMDSSGINVLVAANKSTRANGGWLRLAHIPKPVSDLLHIVGLDEIIPLYPALDDALPPRTAA